MLLHLHFDDKGNIKTGPHKLRNPSIIIDILPVVMITGTSSQKKREQHFSYWILNISSRRKDNWKKKNFLWKGPVCSFPQTLVGNNSWELASQDMVVTSAQFPVFDLVKGEQYQFRVHSINKHGVSDPSEPSKPISLGNPQGEIKWYVVYFPCLLLCLLWRSGRLCSSNSFT